MSGHYVNNLTGDFSLCFSEHLTGHPIKVVSSKGVRELSQMYRLR